MAAAKHKTSELFRRLTKGTKIVSTTHGARVFSVEVDPAIAEELLSEGNDGNRKIRPTKLVQYREEMEKGRWRLQNTCLVTELARLIDGQHRLSAIIETGLPQLLLFQIVEGKEEEAANLAVDGGAIRTLGDTLHFRGVKHANRVAAFLVHERAYRVLQDPSASVNTSKTSYLRLLREVTQTRVAAAIEIVPRGLAVKLGLKQSIVDWCAFHFMASDPVHAELFLQAIMDGDANDDKAIFVLREELLRMNGARKTKGVRTSATDSFHMMVKGWNAFFDSQEVTRRALHAKAREEFPEIRGN
jgi:hypothetical protein